MKLSNFVWLLLIIVIIAVISLLYTSSQNDVVEEMNNEVQVEATASIDRNMNGLNEVVFNPITFNNTFEHTKPGEYSTIFVDVSGLEPGEFTIMYVRKAGTEEYIEAGGQEQTVDENGQILTSFTITEFGDYEVYFSYKGESITSPTISVN